MLFAYKLIPLLICLICFGAHAHASETLLTKAEHSLQLHASFKEHLAQQFTELKTWVTDNGGYVNPKLHFNVNQIGIRGVFSVSSLQVGDRLLSLPSDILLAFDRKRYPYFFEKQDTCFAASWTLEELRKGPESFWAPYFNTEGTNHSAIWEWSEQATNELQGLLARVTVTVEDKNAMFDGCGLDAQDPDVKRVHKMIVTRLAWAGFIPIFNLMNHDHPSRMNIVDSMLVERFEECECTECPPVSEWVPAFGETNCNYDQNPRNIVIRASKDVAAGGELINSYTLANQGWSDDLFKFHLFVGTSQKWRFSFEGLASQVETVYWWEFDETNQKVTCVPCETREEIETFEEKIQMQRSLFPTTLEEDRDILFKLGSIDSDVRMAVQYRIKFKTSLVKLGKYITNKKLRFPKKEEL